MAFFRTSFSALKASRKENFESTYKFRKKVDFKLGSDVYVIPLGLERGFFETPTHRVITHEVEGQTIGFGGSGYPVTIKCKGFDEEGNRVESLCCKLARLEKERFPEKDDASRRVINFSSNRIHLPVLILGNSLTDKSKIAYPISKVSILSDLNSEKGLNFSYLEMASSTFQKDIFNKLGEELKNQGILDYELSENSEEFYAAVGQHLTNCIIKVKGVTKQGFSVALQDYSFFPFAVPSIANTIASGSYQGDRETILGFKSNPQIMEKVNEYLQLFNSEVDKLFRDWTDNELQEYYNSAIGVDLKTNLAPLPSAEEKVEIISEVAPMQPLPQVVQPLPQAPTYPTPAAQAYAQQQLPPAPQPMYQQGTPQVQPVVQQQLPPAPQPMVQTVAPQPVAVPPVQQVAQPAPAAATDEELNAFLNDPFNGQDPVSGVSESSVELDDFEMDLGADDDFLP